MIRIVREIFGYLRFLSLAVPRTVRFLRETRSHRPRGPLSEAKTDEAA